MSMEDTTTSHRRNDRKEKFKSRLLPIVDDEEDIGQEEENTNRNDTWTTTCAFVGLGLGSWITTNGIFQELPHVARTVPEGYDIFSYATLLVSFSNIFAIGYFCFRT